MTHSPTNSPRCMAGQMQPECSSYGERLCLARAECLYPDLTLVSLCSWVVVVAPHFVYHLAAALRVSFAPSSRPLKYIAAKTCYSFNLSLSLLLPSLQNTTLPLSLPINMPPAPSRAAVVRLMNATASAGCRGCGRSHTAAHSCATGHTHAPKRGMATPVDLPGPGNPDTDYAFEVSTALSITLAWSTSSRRSF